MLSYRVEIECQTDIIDVSNIGHYYNVT